MPDLSFNADYASKKQNLDDVRRGLLRRMMWSQERHNKVSEMTTTLTELCDELVASYMAHGDSNSTVAVGYMPGAIMVATQGISFSKSQLEVSQFLADYHCFDPSKDEIFFLTVTTLNLGSSFTGIHAEMMIVRWLLMQRGLSKQALSTTGLHIATTTAKGCCPNCAGWLNMYAIPHTARREKLSQMWRHPVSLNRYLHSTVDPFVSDPKVRYDGHAQGAAEINQKGTVLRTPQATAARKTGAFPIDKAKNALEKSLTQNIFEDDKRPAWLKAQYGSAPAFAPVNVPDEEMDAD